MSALLCLLAPPVSPTHAPSLRFQQRHVLQSIHCQSNRGLLWHFEYLQICFILIFEQILLGFFAGWGRLAKSFEWLFRARLSGCWQAGKSFGSGQIVSLLTFALPFPDLKEFTITNYPKAWQPNHWRSNYPRPDLCSSCMSLPPKKKCPKQSIGPKSQDPQDKKMHPEMMREKNVRFPCFQFAPWSGCTQSQTLTEEVLSTDSTGIEYDIQGLHSSWSFWDYSCQNLEKPNTAFKMTLQHLRHNGVCT